jgi:thiol-disulfide isomerase/thioredoxin
LSLKAAALLLTSAWFAAPAQEIPATIPADAAEQLVFRELDGAERRLSEHRGSVVVLNFWATWCIPCREEMPLLGNIQKRYTERGVVVIGASTDDESTALQIPSFVQKIGINFPVWKGATTEHMQALGMGTGLPVTAILDQNGQLVFRLLGIVQKKDLETRLEFLLDARHGRQPAALVDRLSEHEGEEHHSHGGVGMEGASTVPS